MEKKDVNSRWKECLKTLRAELSETSFNTWFRPIVPVSFADGILVLQLQSYAVSDYIEDNYIQLFSRAIFRVFGAGTKLEYRILIDSQSGAGACVTSDRMQQESTRNEVLGAKAQTAFAHPQEPELPALDSRLNPLYTFESFVEGECNKLVRSVGLAAAKNPGNNSFNPLFIYGGSGVGKTHLLNAIGNQVLQLYPEKRVLYLSANEFKTQYMHAGQQGHVSDFLQFYQTIDVLLIDDVQFLAGQSQQKTQEQFFHIFNYLHQARKQIVMTSDRPPMEIKDLEDRLLTRLKWGFQGEMGKPDFLLRKDILRNKMSRDGIDLPDEVTCFIAENVRDNVRDLEGVLASLLAYSTLMNANIDLALAEKVVGNVVEIGSPEIKIDSIVEVVCAEFDQQPRQLVGQLRLQKICTARQVAMFLAKEKTGLSLQEIGSYFGGRSHATVLHAVAAVQNQMDTDPAFKARVMRIRSKLNR